MKKLKHVKLFEAFTEGGFIPKDSVGEGERGFVYSSEDSYYYGILPEKDANYLEKLYMEKAGSMSEMELELYKFATFGPGTVAFYLEGSYTPTGINAANYEKFKMDEPSGYDEVFDLTHTVMNYVGGSTAQPSSYDDVLDAMSYMGPDED